MKKTKKTFNDGDVIFREGGPSDAAYEIVSGTVEIAKMGNDGNVILATLGAGEMFGEMALIDTNPRSATATAVTKCKLAAVDERRFTFLVQQTPFFALYVMRLMTQRLRAIDDTIS